MDAASNLHICGEDDLPSNFAWFDGLGPGDLEGDVVAASFCPVASVEPVCAWFVPLLYSQTSLNPMLPVRG